jgi:hypothetical protein
MHDRVKRFTRFWLTMHMQVVRGSDFYHTDLHGSNTKSIMNSCKSIYMKMVIFEALLWSKQGSNHYNVPCSFFIYLSTRYV